MDSILLKNANIISEDQIIRGGNLKIEDGIITQIDDIDNFDSSTQIIDLKGLYLAPGFIDIHTHGAVGKDTMDCDYNVFEVIAKYKASKGTTSFLLTTLTASQEKILDVAKLLNRYLHREDSLGNILGIHLEGPYINIDKKGAQNAKNIRVANTYELDEIINILGNKLKLITLAPEIEGASKLIPYAYKQGIVVSVGHSNGSYDEIKRGFNCGVRSATHLFNGMRGLHHRKPGVVGACLEDDRIAVELIVDNHHLHPAIVKLVIKMKSFEKIILVSDSMRATGMPDGSYDLGGLEAVIKDGVARLSAGNLAGSTLDLNDALKNLIDITGLNLVEGIKPLTLNPAKLLGIADSKGSISIGKDADLVVFDQDFNVLMTIIAGRIVYNVLDK
ncbi:N-acetylglucosamine-6-phosphate deacetylase [Orenia marismortui]|uniref:N-acetylglucosamine-6-phosphate deacetylase n=1 Tax=Orenia marismortui TaxID=46469 RepID=UPI00036C7824|nr:N-acetylglucosamine-6-phosphate deacetylase [Orenia marismortui]